MTDPVTPKLVESRRCRTAPPGGSVTARFVVTRAVGRAWDPAKAVRQQPGWAGHAAFMDALAVQGVVAFGGPAGQGSTFVLVADASDEAALRARLRSDPWTRDGLLVTVSVQAWEIWLGGDDRLRRAGARTYQLVTYRPGPHWEAKPRQDQAGWDTHAAFMDALVDQGLVVLGGPLDEERALIVTCFPDEQTAHAQLAADPWLDGTLIIESIQPWTLWLDAASVKGRPAGPAKSTESCRETISFVTLGRINPP
jgi:uncharacterized protein YciI